MINTQPKVALITGAAKRIGATIARKLHAEGYNIVIHHNHSVADAETLAIELNQLRNDSAITTHANLVDIEKLKELATIASSHWGRIDLLVNNASSFYATPIGKSTEDDWDKLIGSNVKAPFFLAQELAIALTKTKGCIINIADIYAERPLHNHSIYSIAKAGNVMLTKALAQELAPHVRVNGIAPGAILWPEEQGKMSDTEKHNLLKKIPLGELGQVDDIAQAILFLAQGSTYITGHILPVDGGRLIRI